MLAALMRSVWPSIRDDRQGPSLHHWPAVALGVTVCGQSRPGTSGVVVMLIPLPVPILTADLKLTDKHRFIVFTPNLSRIVNADS